MLGKLETVFVVIMLLLQCFFVTLILYAKNICHVRYFLYLCTRKWRHNLMSIIFTVVTRREGQWAGYRHIDY